MLGCARYSRGLTNWMNIDVLIIFIYVKRRNILAPVFYGYLRDKFYRQCSMSRNKNVDAEVVRWLDDWDKASAQEYLS